MPQKLTQQIYNQLDLAANQLAQIVFEAFESERGVHLETAIAAPASLAGTLILAQYGDQFFQYGAGGTAAGRKRE